MSYLVGSKGQIVIAKEIRDQLGVQPGWSAMQRLVDGHLEVYFAPPEHNDSLLGCLAPYTSVSIPSEEELDRACEDAWAEAAAEEDAAVVAAWCERAAD